MTNTVRARVQQALDLGSSPSKPAAQELREQLERERATRMRDDRAAYLAGWQGGAAHAQRAHADDVFEQEAAQQRALEQLERSQAALVQEQAAHERCQAAHGQLQVQDSLFMGYLDRGCGWQRQLARQARGMPPLPTLPEVPMALPLHTLASMFGALQFLHDFLLCAMVLPLHISQYAFKGPLLTHTLLLLRACAGTSLLEVLDQPTSLAALPCWWCRC